jgi:hypothetical protein
VTSSPETPDEQAPESPAEQAPDSAPAQRGKYKPSKTRLVVWIVLVGVGLYLVISGLVGIIVKGQ